MIRSISFGIILLFSGLVFGQAKPLTQAEFKAIVCPAKGTGDKG